MSSLLSALLIFSAHCRTDLSDARSSWTKCTLSLPDTFLISTTAVLALFKSRHAMITLAPTTDMQSEKKTFLFSHKFIEKSEIRFPGFLANTCNLCFRNFDMTYVGLMYFCKYFYSTINGIFQDLTRFLLFKLSINAHYLLYAVFSSFLER